MRDDEPRWQPLSVWTMLTAPAAEGVQLARGHLDTLGQAHPYRLDDATVGGVIRTLARELRSATIDRLLGRSDLASASKLSSGQCRIGVYPNQTSGDHPETVRLESSR